MKSSDNAEDFWRLDRTFGFVLAVVTLILVPFVNTYIMQESPPPIVRFVIPFFLVPLVSSVILWWISTFFNKLALRMVCWYILFHLVLHSVWTIVMIYIFSLGEPSLLGGELGLILGGIWVVSSYFVPLIPWYFVFLEYSKIEMPSTKRSGGGVFLFIVITYVITYLFSYVIHPVG